MNFRRLRIGYLLIGVLLTLGAISACSSAGASSNPYGSYTGSSNALAQAPTSAPTTAPIGATFVAPAPAVGAALQIAQNATLGNILTDGQGRTLYLFMKDTKNTSNCYDACATNWPPFLSQAQPTLGNGIKTDLIGSTQRKDGSTQITYSGWPLYYFAKDQQPGDINGQGVGDVWFALTPDGNAVNASPLPAGTAPANASSPAPTTSSTTSAQAGGTNVSVSMKNVAFNPQAITVQAGTTVVWSNDETSATPHTVTAGTAGAPSGAFDSNTLNPGQSFQFIFTTPGTFAYYCRIHGAAMTGTVTVTP